MNTFTRTPLTAALAALLLTASWSAPALALKKEIVDEKIEKTEAKAEGWEGKIKLGANISLSSSNNVVGAQDGVTFAMGAAFEGELSLVRGGHEWRNRLEINETFTKTPTIDRVIKSTDFLLFDSVYLYTFEAWPWIGPFVRFGLKTALLPGYDVQAQEHTYTTTKLDGSTFTEPNKDSKRLTDSFMPLLLKQSAGAFGKPYKEKFFGIELRLGLGAQEFFGDDQLATTKVNSDTKTVSVKELQDYQQVGGEASVQIDGSVYEDKISYRVYAEAMIPFYTSIDDKEDRNAGELTNVELGAGLNFKLVEWASLVYEFKAVRLPLVVDEFQIQNNLLLSFSYSMTKKRGE